MTNVSTPGSNRVFIATEQYRSLDPFAAIAAPNTKLYSIKDLAGFSRGYCWPIPTVVPDSPNPRNTTRPKSFSCDGDYLAELYEQVHLDGCLVKALLEPFAPGKRLALAGGSAAAPFYGMSTSKPSDVDFFILDEAVAAPTEPDADTIAALYKHVRYVVEKDPVLTKRSGPMLIAKGVMTLYREREYIVGQEPLLRNERNIPPLQFVLSSWPSVASLLGHFDIGASSVAVSADQNSKLVPELSSIGAYAMLYGVNLVVPGRCDRNCGDRLGKYFQRGFDIGLPHLDLSRGVPQSITLAGGLITLDITAAAGNRLVAGRVACQRFKLPGTETLLAQADESGELSQDFSPYVSAVDQQLLALRSHDARHTMLQKINASVLVYAANRPTFVAELMYQDRGGLAWADDIPRVLPDLFQDKELPKPQWVWHPTQLAKQHAMTFTEALEAIRVAALVHGSRRVVLGDGPWRARERARRERWLTTPVRFGVEFDSEHCNGPMRLSVEKFYKGLPFRQTFDATSVDFSNMMLAVSADGNTAPQTCTICQSEIVCGSVNTITLQCGHCFHASAYAHCSGLLPWVKNGNKGCPNCRWDFAGVWSPMKGPSFGVVKLAPPEYICRIESSATYFDTDDGEDDLASLLERTAVLHAQPNLRAAPVKYELLTVFSSDCVSDCGSDCAPDFTEERSINYQQLIEIASRDLLQLDREPQSDSSNGSSSGELLDITNWIATQPDSGVWQ